MIFGGLKQNKAKTYEQDVKQSEAKKQAELLQKIEDLKKEINKSKSQR